VRGQRHASAAFYPRERPGTHCTWGWVGPRAGLDVCEKSRSPPGFDPRTVQPAASRYTDWATRPILCASYLFWFFIFVLSIPLCYYNVYICTIHTFVLLQCLYLYYPYRCVTTVFMFVLSIPLCYYNVYICTIHTVVLLQCLCLYYPYRCVTTMFIFVLSVRVVLPYNQSLGRYKAIPLALQQPKISDAVF
jgi:hypothetical protein